MDDKTLIVRDKEMGSLNKVAALYESSTLLRSVIQLVPSIGSSTDFLISKTAQDYIRKRHETFLQEIFKRLEHLESLPESINDEEGLFDIITSAHEKVLKSRLEIKIKRFSRVVADYISLNGEWDESDTLIKLISELSETHISILIFALSIPQSGPYDGLKVFYISQKDLGDDKNIPVLADNINTLSNAALRMFCSELIARGLLFNEGSNRPWIGGMKLLRATDLTTWLISRIS